MIISESGAPFSATAATVTGLIGTIATEILRSDGTNVTDRSTAGIIEKGTTGLYIAALTAPPLQGRYTLVWSLASLETPTALATEELIVALHGEILIDAQEYAPTVAEVAAYIRARTRDHGVNEIGTFTPTTTPTDAEVTTVIRNAAGWLASHVGDTVAAPLARAARETVALRAASMVELQFFGDQITAGRSPYNELKALADQAFQQLLDARRDLGSDELAGTDDDLSPAGLAVFSFPDPVLDHVPGTEWPVQLTAWRW